MKKIVLVLLACLVLFVFTTTSQGKDNYIGMKCPYCGTTSNSSGLSPDEEGNCRECLKTYSVAEGRKTYEEYTKINPPSKDYAKMANTFTYICNTQGDEAGRKYLNTLTHEELEGFTEWTRAKQRSQATRNVIGNVLGAAASIFGQQAEQAQQRANEIRQEMKQNQPKTTTGTITPDGAGGYRYRETTQ